MKIRNRIKELRHVKANELHPNSKNWRTHPKAQQDALKGILAEIGYADALLAREKEDGSLVLVDGHLRAETTPEEEVPVLILDIDEAESDKLLLSLDPLAALAETNATALDSLLREVDTGSEGLQEMYADMADAADLYKDDTTEIEEDEVPEPPADPVTQPGDLWTLGNHRLLCGDSTKQEDVDRLMDGVKADITITSPPYNAAKNSHLNGKVKGFENKYTSHSDELNDSEYLDLLTNSTKLSINASKYVFFNIQLLSHNKQNIVRFQSLMLEFMKDVFIWNKKTAPPNIVQGAFNTKFEFVFVFSKDCKTRGFPCSWRGKHSNVIETENNSGNEFAESHKAGFPVSFPAWFFNTLDFAKSAYEPFCGTGSTLIAAEQLNRTCYGMELSPQYCDVIVQRWETLTGQKAERQDANGKTRPTT